MLARTLGRPLENPTANVVFPIRCRVAVHAREHASGAHYVDALPTALVEPFSGGTARAILIETMKSQGVDSFPALAAATIQ